MFFIQKFPIYSNFVTYDRGPYNHGLAFNLGFGMAMNFLDVHLGFQIVGEVQTV